MAPVRAAVRHVLAAHEPFPAMAVDRMWNLLDANAAVSLLSDGIAPELMRPPANMLRASLHPDGLAPRIVNLGEWRANVISSLGRLIAVSADPKHSELLDELLAYPGGGEPPAPAPGRVAVPLRLRHGDRELAFLATHTTFGTPLDITVAELSIEAFFPADAGTADFLRTPLPPRMSGGFATVPGMRFLHTSDWHLGRSLHRADLRDAQAAFLDHLVETVRDERVDAVLVAGDVYDRAIPPVDSVALYEDALVRFRAAGARVILISGNHDSARRLGVNSALVDAAGVHLRTRPGGLAEPVTLHDEHGPVAVYGVPYLEPAVGLPPDGQAPAQADRPDPPRQRGHAAVLGDAVARIRAAAAASAAARTVVMAHAWVAGGADDEERKETARGQASGSERDISVGGIGYVPAALFDGFSYVALGHLHGQQTLTERVRYSGSPLPYSFSEKHHKKGSWLVEVGIDGKTTAERVPAPVYRRLTELSGRIDDLLTSAEHEPYEDDFVGVTLTDAARPDAAMDRLRRRFPHILTLEFRPEGVTADRRSYRERISGRDDLTIAAEFVRHVRNTDASQPERELLEAAFASARDTANDAREGDR
jgi:exonuclease SbcD